MASFQPSAVSPSIPFFLAFLDCLSGLQQKKETNEIQSRFIQRIKLQFCMHVQLYVRTSYFHVLVLFHT